MTSVLDRATIVRSPREHRTQATVFGLDVHADTSLSFLQGARATPTGNALELSVAPADPLTAADTEIALRDSVRGTALIHGYRASFAPKPFLDQIEKLEWRIRSLNDKSPASEAAPRIKLLTEFWRNPDGLQPFATWLREALEDVLVLDAAAFEIRRNRTDVIAC